MAEDGKNSSGHSALTPSPPAGLDATLPLGDRTLASGSEPCRAPADASTPIFAVAELIGERYRIVRLIGEGGMGEVYEAEDLLLKERVALKTVRQDVARDEKVVERFKREIQLARRVTHANVCRIFDVGLHKRAAGKGELAFLTMELLDGETLAQRLARVGRFAPAEALPIVAQVAAGLDAAHDVGVVHRDFKPSNVMLVASDGDRGRLRAVVTDFGLARGRAASADPSVTGDGGVVGSPAYMAPEQVEGTEVTSAADIYSLGIVIYEMVTGRLPFIGDSPLSTAVMRLREAPVTPCAHVAGLEPTWEESILACLQRSPRDRPRSARALLERLAGPTRPRRRLRLVIPAAAMVLALVLGWKLFGHAPRLPTVHQAAMMKVTASPDTSGRRSVAVIGFKNLTNQADAGWICDALSEMIATELAASTDVRTVPTESVARAKRELGIKEEISFAPDTLARLRSVLDTDYVLTGSYMSLGKAGGNRLRFDLKLQDTRTGDTVAVLSQTGTEAELVELVAASGAALRGKLSLGDLTPSERESVRASMPSADVVRLYAEGLAQLRVEACSSARGPLEQAVAGDPNFPLAHSALAEALACLGYADRARTEAQRAVELSQRLPDHIRLAAQAKLYELTNQPERAVDVYQKLFDRFPDNFDYGYKLALSQLRLLREDDLQRTLAGLRRLPPPAGDSPRLDLIESLDALITGRAEDALRIAASAQKRAEDRGERLVAAGALLAQVRVLDHLGRLDEALAAVTRAREVYEAASDQDGVAQTLAAEASLREGKGDTAFKQKAEDQIATIAGALHNPKELLYFRFMMAQRFAGQGDYDGAMRAYSDARELAEAQGDLRLASAMVMQVGYIELARGSLAEARKLIEGALKPEIGPEVRANLLIILASTLYGGGDSEGARARLAEAESLVKRGASRTAVILMRAQLACEDGDFKTAEKLAREALGAEKALAPLAYLDLATALVGQKRWTEALAVLPEIETSPLVEGPVMKLMVSSIEARALAASDLGAARKKLADGIQAAGTMGLAAIALELRLRLGEVEVHHGDAAKGRALLADVAAEAKRTGLASIEHRALRDE